MLHDIEFPFASDLVMSITIRARVGSVTYVFVPKSKHPDVKDGIVTSIIDRVRTHVAVTLVLTSVLRRRYSR